jgi:spectinomycin phosphotransferase
MLEKPELKDEEIINCLKVEHGLNVEKITFLPLGGDLSTAVYRGVTDDETPYFCKLKSGVFDEVSVELPKFLSGQGIPQIIPPLTTKTGQLWAELDEFRLILYPFVDGISGFEVELSEHQWADFSTALKRIHTTVMPAALIQKIQKESYSPESRDICRNVIKRLDEETFDDPVTSGLAAFLGSRRETVLDLIGRAEQLAHALVSRSMELVLCHSDIHPGNLFIDTKGTLFIVDWDYPMLAPKERDLMFIGGGQGFRGVTAQEEEMNFYRNYGRSQIDPLALAYYRCERNLYDLSVECTRIFSSTGGDQDRARSLEIITWLFLPEGSIDRAYAADQTLNDR